MDDDLIRLSDLLESGAAMAELTAGLSAAVLSEAAGARDFLPRRIE